MTQTLAIANARQLRTHLLDAGVETVSIELVEGRGGSGWLKATHIGSMGHHTVSRRSNGNTPCLKLVKVGRPGLPGPLCNGYGGFDEVARIICMAWANHPGEGGPLKAEAGTVPKNNGRPYFFGWEFEGGLAVADFTPSYRRFMASCLAGTLDFLRRTPASHAEHKTWAPGRKVDRLGYTLDKARQEIADKGDDMAPLRKLGDNANDVNLWKRALNVLNVKQGWGLPPIEEGTFFSPEMKDRVAFYQKAAQILDVPGVVEGSLDAYTCLLLAEYTREDG